MRTPLHLKVMLSYMLVLVLVVLPTFVYMRTFHGREVRGLLRDELHREATQLAAGFSRLSDHELEAAIGFAVMTSTRRLTVFDREGRVMGGSLEATEENPFGLPEMQQALASPNGLGLSERESPALSIEAVYVAARFPRTGPLAGIVRLAGSTAGIEETSAGSVEVLRIAGALGGTAAVLFSLFIAFAVSRPLRRIADGARAFARGDFAHEIGVRSRDELGEVTAALEELAARLRERLLSVGADRASLHALLDDLPVGVVLYTQSLSTEAVNGRARTLCALSPNTETQRTDEIVKLADQTVVAERVLADGFTREAPLVLPWAPGAALRARWTAVPVRDGSRQLALIILEESQAEQQLAQTVPTLARAAGHLREGARLCPDTAAAATLQRVAEECEAVLPVPPTPTAAEVQAVVLSSLCEAALADVAPLAARRGVSLKVEVAAHSVKVVEAGGRVERALRNLLAKAVERAAQGDAVALRSEAGATHVTLFARAPAGSLDAIRRLVEPLGGEVGASGAGERSEAWLQVPKA